MNTIHHIDSSRRNLSIAIFINIILTIVQIAAGIFSGSLALIADAIHNLSDAVAIIIALIAKTIASKKSNSKYSYGFKRAEIIGTLINSLSLIIIGLYLINESFNKFFEPTLIDGYIVFYVAAVALVIDILTAILTYKAGAKESINIKAAFIHNVSDALSSVAVIVVGILIIFFDLYIADIIITVMISAYVIIHGFLLLMKSLEIFMQATPDTVKLDSVSNLILEQSGVMNILDIHLWQLNDTELVLECKIEVDSLHEEVIKENIRYCLNQNNVSHITIETVKVHK